MNTSATGSKTGNGGRGTAAPDVDAVVVGAGFAGLYMLSARPLIDGAVFR